MLIFRLDALLLYAAALLCAPSVIAAPSVAREVHDLEAVAERNEVLDVNIEPRQGSAIVAGVVIAVSWLADLIELGTTVSFTLGEITGISVAVEAAAGSAGTVVSGAGELVGGTVVFQAGVTFGVVEAVTEVTYGIASRGVISAVLKRAVQSNNGANIAAYVSTAAQALAVR